MPTNLVDASKRYVRRAIDFIDRAEMDALLSAPDQATRIGRRDRAIRFGDTNYAKEEPRAELASVFIAAERGIPHDPEQHRPISLRGSNP